MVEANAFHIFLLLGFSFFLLSSIFYHVGRFLWKRAREKWRERLKSNGRIVSETRSNGRTIQRIVPRFAHRNTSPIHKTLISILDRSWRIRLYVGLQTYYFIDEFLIIKFDQFFFYGNVINFFKIFFFWVAFYL